MNLNMKRNDSGTNIRIGEVRFSYAQVFEPKKINENSKAKYSVSLLIDKSNKEAIDLINEAIEAAIAMGIERYHWDPKVTKGSSFKRPLRDGEDARPDDPAYENKYFLNANNERKPGVQAREDGIRYDAGPEDFYSGCYGAATITFYPFEVPGNRGIGVSLGNVIKLRDGDRLAGGGESADASFDDLD